MSGSQNAIGLIETRGIVSLVAGIEAMMKTAEVQTINVERIGSGYFSAAIKGSIAAVRQALDSGSAAVKQYGELRSAQLYPRPDAISVGLLDNGTRDLLAGGQRAEAS
ncbi:BMC domain-containing protein [Microtetraspora glauca]|uniref:BMC domain-containing protein n=1 Tax=Microtetraspora glauca TaxID=1996 RepID=A0ABV3GLL9_MICGL